MDIKDYLKFDSKKFWNELDEKNVHVNRRFVLEIMRNLNEWGFLTAEGKKVLENLIIEDSKAFKLEIDENDKM